MEESLLYQIRPEVEVNTYRKANAFHAQVVANKVIVDLGEFNQVNHITLSCEGYNFHEGQSIGIIADGQTDDGKPHAVRLYSIASISPFTDTKVKTLDLCIKRVVYIDEQSGQKVYGVASNFVCNAQIGSILTCTGPAGRNFVLPKAEHSHRPYVFIATGTGIAPFRAMVEKLFRYTPGFLHDVFLIFGVQTASQLLYDDEFRKYSQDNFHYYTALSREQTNKKGGRMYVHDKLAEQIEKIWPVLINDETLIYMCGLKGMEEGFEALIKEQAELRNLDPQATWQNIQNRFEKEVY